MAVLAGVLLPACVTTGDTTTTAPLTTTTPGAASPGEAVRAWLEAVAGESGALPAVDDAQLAILIAVDGSLGPERAAALLDGGLSDDARRGFWDSFAAGFAGSAGAGPATVDTGPAEEFAVGDARFAAVPVSMAGGGTELITIEDGGVWRVDLIASFGPRLVRPLRQLLDAAGSDAAGRAVREALAASAPSLQAAVLRPPPDLPSEFLTETRALLNVLAPAAG